MAFLSLAAMALGFALREREALRQKARALAQEQIARQQRNEAQLAGASSALASRQLLQARAQLRQALESQDSAEARLFWWKLAREPLQWSHTVGHTSYEVVFFPGGRRLAVISRPGTVMVLDSRTGKVLRILRGHRDQIRTLDLSTDGRWLATGTWDGVVEVWDTERWKISRTMTMQKRSIRVLRFSPDGRWLAAGGQNRLLEVWDLKSGEQPPAFKGSAGSIYGLDFSPDGRWLATGGTDRTLRIWDVGSGELLRGISDQKARINQLSFSPDGQQVATIGQDPYIRLWDPRTGVLQQSIKGNTSAHYDLDFSPDGALIAVSSSQPDHPVSFWNIATGKLMAELPTAESHRSFAFSPDGTQLVSTGHVIQSWNVAHHKLEPRASLPVGQLFSVAYSPDGRQVATGGRGKFVQLWDVRTGRAIGRLTGHTSQIFSVVYDPLGRFLATAGRDKLIRLWEKDAGYALRTIGGHQNIIYSLDISPDGRTLASAGQGGRIKLWKLPSGAPAGTLSTPVGVIFNVRFSADGALVAAGGSNGTVFIWDLKRRRLVRRFTRDKHFIGGVAFSPDSTTIASASFDGTLRRHSLLSGKITAQVSLPGRIYRMNSHPREDLLGVGSSKGLLWLLDEQLQVRWEIQAHRSETNEVCFSPLGKLIATCSDDGTVRLWEVETGRPYWHSPALLNGPPRLLTHRGWLSLGADGREKKIRAPAGSWGQGLLKRARRAIQGASGELLCLQTFDGQLEVWSMTDDKMLQRRPASGLRQLIATPRGCVAVFEGEILRLGAAGVLEVIKVDRPVAVAAEGEDLLVATASGAVERIGTRQRHQLLQVPAGTETVSLAKDGPALYLGLADGEILRYPAAGADKKALHFEDVPSSSPVHLSPGPAGILVAGFQSGAVGLWDAKGKQIYLTHLTGSVAHMVYENERLFVATDLGDWLVLDLRSLSLEYCDLLQQVWREIPVVLQRGDPTVQGPPASHRCARREFPSR